MRAPPTIHQLTPSNAPPILTAASPFKASPATPSNPRQVSTVLKIPKSTDSFSLFLFNMSVVPTTRPTLRHPRASASSDGSRDRPTASPKVSILAFRPRALSSSNPPVFSRKFDEIRGRITALSALSQEGSLQEVDDSPVTVALAPISSETQFDRVVAQAQQLDESFVVVWAATWCRKCIYLKPKLEKLAAEYYPRLKFYSVDVNSVPHKLVKRADVTKMPTIQLWKDGKKQAEVIGGHKAHLVINEVREMIENEDSM